MTRRVVRLALCALALSFAPLAVHAQDKPNRHDKPRAAAARRHKVQPVRHKRDAKPRDAKPRDANSMAAPRVDDAKRASDQPSGHAETAPSTTAKPAIQSDAEENVHKEGGTEVKTVEFGGLDIEGQLKTPQMLYFLNRLRAEFERPQLPHRSFMPELQRSTKENAF